MKPVLCFRIGFRYEGVLGGSGVILCKIITLTQAGDQALTPDKMTGVVDFSHSLSTRPLTHFHNRSTQKSFRYTVLHRIVKPKSPYLYLLLKIVILLWSILNNPSFLSESTHLPASFEYCNTLMSRVSICCVKSGIKNVYIVYSQSHLPFIRTRNTCALNTRVVQSRQLENGRTKSEQMDSLSSHSIQSRWYSNIVSRTSASAQAETKETGFCD